MYGLSQHPHTHAAGSKSGGGGGGGWKWWSMLSRSCSWTRALVCIALAALLLLMYYRSCVQKGDAYYAEHGLNVVVLSDAQGHKFSIITNGNDGFFGIVVDLELYVKVLKEIGFQEETRYMSHSSITAAGPSNLPLRDPPLSATKHIVLYVEGDFRSPFNNFLRQYLGIGRVDYSRYCRAMHADAQPPVPCETWLMINQDFPIDSNALGTVDVILTKTRITKSLLQKYIGNANKPRILYTRHSSLRAPPRIPVETKNFSLFVHYNRGSRRKNSEMVYRAWLKHPEWPTLVFVHPKMPWFRAHHGPNMLVHEYLSPADMESLAAHAGVWVCMSSTEGYGHYINEGRAASALIMTSDLPPMNELVTPANGVTVHIARVAHEGYLHIPSAVVGVAEVEDGVRQILALSDAEKHKRAQHSRQAFEDDYAFLVATLRDAAASFFQGHHPQGSRDTTA